MKKPIIYILCLNILFVLSACGTLKSASEIELRNTVITESSDNDIQPITEQQDNNGLGTNKEEAKISPYKSFYNTELNCYEIIDGYSDGFLEIMGEKIGFNGEGYEAISSSLHERILFNAVRFYMAATADDFNTIEKLAGKGILVEIEQATTKEGKQFKLGGNVVTTLKDISLYKKPVSITAPVEIGKNEYKVTMEYSNKDGRHFIEVILEQQLNEIKVTSFLITKD